MLAEFRTRYPQGSLISELIDIDRGLYLVKVAIQVEGIILATGLAGMDKIELAEDRARERALSALALEVHPTTAHPSTAREKTVTSSPPSPKLEEPVLATVTDHPANSDNKNNKNTINNPSAEDTAVVANFIPAATSTAATEQTTITSKSSTATEQPPIAFSEPSKTPSTLSTLATSTSELRELDNQRSEPEVEASTEPNQGTLFAQTDNLPSSRVTEPLPEPDTTEEKSIPEATSEVPVSQTEVVDMDFNQIKHQTDIEIKRLGWTRDDGRNFLQSHYGKRSRLHLTDEELLEFLHYLESLPTPVSS